MHDLGREVHERGVDAADERDGVFDEAGDFVDQAVIGDDGEAVMGGDGGHTLGDEAAAFVLVGDDVVLAQAVGPVGEAADGEGGGGEEAVAFGEVAGGEAVAVIGAFREGEGDDRAVQHADDAAQRADPGEGAGPPAHGFGPGEAAQQGGHRAGDEGGGVHGRAGFGEDPILAFGFQVVAFGAVLAQEAGKGLVGGVGAGTALGRGPGGDGGGDGGGQRDAAGAEAGLDIGGRQRR